MSNLSVAVKMLDDIGNIMAGGSQVMIPADLAVWIGHFPGHPILPGIYLIEVALHLVSLSLPNPATLSKIERCKFIKPVRPGAVLERQIKWLTMEGSERRVKIIFRELKEPEIVAEIQMSIKLQTI